MKKSYAIPQEILDAIVKFENSLGAAWVADCNEIPHKNLRQLWLKVSERHEELLDIIDLKLKEKN